MEVDFRHHNIQGCEDSEEDEIHWKDYLESADHAPVTLHALHYSTMNNINNYISSKKIVHPDIGGRIPNFGGLAEKVGFEDIQIQNFARLEQPGYAMLQKWRESQNLSVKPIISELMRLLAELGREDILTDCSRAIAEDAQYYIDRQKQIKPVQEPTVSSEPGTEGVPQLITRREVDTGQKVVYDAYVCYNAYGKSGCETKFVEKLIDKFESPEYNISLFIPERDSLPGLSEHVKAAEVISEKCRHMIVVLSHDFAESEACKFQTVFAHSLSPAATKIRIIPVIIEKSVQIPNILRSVNCVNFATSLREDWLWERLARSIKQTPQTKSQKKEDSNSGKQAVSSPQKDSAQPNTYTQPREGEVVGNPSDSGFSSSIENGKPSSKPQNISTRQPVDSPQARSNIYNNISQDKRYCNMKDAPQESTMSSSSSSSLSSSSSATSHSDESNRSSFGSKTLKIFKKKFSGTGSKKKH